MGTNINRTQNKRGGLRENSKVSVMLQSVEEEEKVKVNNVYFENRTGGNGTWFLTEDGLYEALLQNLGVEK